MGRHQKVVTFDFDNTLCFYDGKPNQPMIELVRKYAEEDYKCYVVTARNRDHESKKWISKNQPDRVRIKDFIKEYNIPIKQVHFTDHEPKGATLWRVGSVLHYDDRAEELRSAKEYGIEARETL